MLGRCVFNHIGLKYPEFDEPAEPTAQCAKNELLLPVTDIWKNKVYVHEAKAMF